MSQQLTIEDIGLVPRELFFRFAEDRPENLKPVLCVTEHNKYTPGYYSKEVNKWFDWYAIEINVKLWMPLD